MANEVLIDGWLGADPNDYPETAEKARFGARGPHPRASANESERQHLVRG